MNPHGFPEGTRCTGTSLAFIRPLSVVAGEDRLSLIELRPRSTVCYRTWNGKWNSLLATDDGTAEVPVDVRNRGVGSINEVLAESPGGVWKKFVATRESSAGDNVEPRDIFDLPILVAGGFGVLLIAAFGWRWVSMMRRGAS